MVEAGTGTVLDARELSAFNGAQYLVWNVRGNVSVRVSVLGGANAVVSGIFCDAATATPKPLSFTPQSSLPEVKTQPSANGKKQLASKKKAKAKNVKKTKRTQTTARRR